MMMVIKVMLLMMLILINNNILDFINIIVYYSIVYLRDIGEGLGGT